MFANVQHRTAHIVHAHNQLGRRFQLPRNLRKDVSGFHHVFHFLRRRVTREQKVDVHFAEQIPGFFGVQSGWIFLDEGDERVASFGQFPFLPQLRRRLKFGETDVRRGRRRNFSALFLFHCHFLFDEAVVAEPGGSSEDDQCQQQHEEPLHGWQRTIVNWSQVQKLSRAREYRCERKALTVLRNRRSTIKRIVREAWTAPV